MLERRPYHGGGHHTSVYRYLMGGVKKRESGSSQQCPATRQVGTLKYKNFYLNVRNAFSTVRVIK